MKAEFVISNSTVDRCPKSDLPEVAFIGRSNVGKSSLINKLTGRPGLAKASSTPGKTLLINHFLIDDRMHFVDLPGYGYARVSKTDREKLKQMIEGYCTRREQLYCLFVLLDIRLEPQRIDREFMAFLGEQGVPFAMVFTKADKLSKAALKRNVEAYRTAMLEEWEELPPQFITSAETGLGCEELLEYINGII